MLVPLTLALVLGLMYITGAQAVHDAGLFELDVPSANAQDDVGSETAGDDWDNICQDNPTTCSFASGFSASASSAIASSHENDGDLDATIFHGGGSKDPEPIANWLWKDGAGGLPDKDNLLHAYAARYSTAVSTECPSTGATCEVIYFGSDRYANDGDATQAFWFLQNPIAANGPASQGGFRFTGGGHKDGDLLIISEFSNGGTTSTIAVYRWTGTDASGGLTLLSAGDNKSCAVVASPDPYCGIVNTSETPTPAPWPFLDKAGSTSFRQGELFEAGINISHPSINLGGACFSSFVAETRASTSTTATLKDFVLGGFQTCQPAMTTQVSATAAVAPGTPVTDTARITVTGALNPADPTGTVTFYLCPTASGDCSTGGTNIGTGTLANQSGGTVTDGIAEATSPTVNDSAQTGARGTLGAGRYCFRAEWPGDTNYPRDEGDPLKHTNAFSGTTVGAECFIVQDTTSLTSAQEWLPNDEATVSSGSGTTPISGTLSFTLFSGDNCGETSGGKLYPTSAASEDFTLTNATTLADRTKKTTNTTVRVTASGETKVSWKVVFAPASGSNLTGSTHCEKTTLNITN